MKKTLLCGLSLLALCACDNSRYAYDDAYWGNGDYDDYNNRNGNWDNDHRDGNRNYDRGGHEGGREGGHSMGGGGHGGGHR